VLGLPPSLGPAPPFECPQPVQSQSLLQPVSPLPAPSPYTGPTGDLAERRAPASCPASPARPACTSRRTSRPRPPAVPGTHQMALRPSTASLRVPLPSPLASSLPALPPFYVLVYVDDLVFATADTAGPAHVKSKLQKRHTCTDLCELRSYLGLQITQDRAQRTITLTQSHMVQQ
ncbi:unnamed protein product, partial [Closterium sp. NIES-53]